MGGLVNTLLDALDPDMQVERAKTLFDTETPTDEQVKQATQHLIERACGPFDQPKLRNTLIGIRQRHEQTIDIVSQDRLIDAGYDAQAREKAQTIVGSFERFIAENKDELTALQLIYSRPYGKRELTYEQIDELAEAIKKPPHQLTQEGLFEAYRRLDASRVRGAGPAKLLTNLVSLLRFAIGETDVLEPWPMTVEERFQGWLAAQERMGRTFTPEQMDWLAMIRDHVGTSLTISLEDFEYAPFHEKGGPIRAYHLFGRDLGGLLVELNEVLAA